VLQTNSHAGGCGFADGRERASQRSAPSVRLPHQRSSMRAKLVPQARARSPSLSSAHARPATTPPATTVWELRPRNTQFQRQAPARAVITPRARIACQTGERLVFEPDVPRMSHLPSNSLRAFMGINALLVQEAGRATCSFTSRLRAMSAPASPHPRSPTAHRL
jgi:hypothetical protein